MEGVDALAAENRQIVSVDELNPGEQYDIRQANGGLRYFGNFVRLQPSHMGLHSYAFFNNLLDPIHTVPPETQRIFGSDQFNFYRVDRPTALAAHERTPAVVAWELARRRRQAPRVAPAATAAPPPTPSEMAGRAAIARRDAAAKTAGRRRRRRRGKGKKTVKRRVQRR